MDAVTVYRSWSGPARVLAQGVDAVVSAARAGDADAFEDALAGLRQVDREQLATVLGAVVAHLLESRHPDGLDSDDAEQALAACLAGASWYPHLDREPLILALTGALGVGDPDEDQPVDRAPVLVHGLLLVGELLAGDELAPTLDIVLREVQRAQTVELP